jgi:hypothetical protein
MQVVGVEDVVVAFAVAVGPGDAETQAGGFQGEGQFGELSATLGGELAGAGGFGRGGPGAGGFSAGRWGASTRAPRPRPFREYSVLETKRAQAW